MKKSVFNLVFFLVSVMLFSCSKEDSETNQINENGGQISRYQVVTVDVGSIALTDNYYAGTFVGNPIQLVKTTEHELAFYVPETTPLGAAELVITSLNNAKVKYEVTDVVLTQSVEQTLAPLETNFVTYGNQLTTSPEDIPFVQNHNSMLTYYNGLSDSEKAEVAKFYKANKSIIDAVYNTDYSNIQGRSAQNDIDAPENRALVRRFKASLLVGILGATVAVAGPSNIIQPIAIGVAIAGVSSALDYHFQLIDRNLNIIQIKVNAILGINDRSANTQLTLTDNVTSTLPFAVNARPIQEVDSGSQQEYMKLYFTTRNRLNNLITDANDAILWVNENIPLVSFNTIPLAVSSSSATPASAQVDSQIMQNFNFSLSHPNLSLETASLQSDGQLNLKIKFIGNPTTTPISSTLDYSYSDDFSIFSGSFPIVVNGEADIEKVEFQFDNTAYNANLNTKSNIMCNGSGNDFYRFRNSGNQWHLTFYLPHFHTNPIGATFLLNDGTDYCSNGYGRIFFRTWDENDVETNWWPQNVSLTKTGANSFSFTGTLILYGGTEVKPISGTGIIKP